VLKSDTIWAFGTVAVAAPAQSEGGPESYLFIAKLTTHWEAAIEFTAQFEQWLSQVPPNVVSANEKQVLDISGIHTAGDGSSQLGFPFPIGERWTYTGGPHHYCGTGFASCLGGSDRPWSSLDFSGGSGHIVAAQDGVAYYACHLNNGMNGNEIKIYHAGGWQTDYYHVRNFQITNGQSVTRNQYLGDIFSGTWLWWFR